MIIVTVAMVVTMVTVSWIRHRVHIFIFKILTVNSTQYGESMVYLRLAFIPCAEKGGKFFLSCV